MRISECGIEGYQLSTINYRLIMRDDKRLLREIKRSIKQTGNRKRRRFLKDLNVEPDEFSYDNDSSAFMNEPRRTRRDDEDSPPSEHE